MTRPEKIKMVVHADGRRGFPGIVTYQVLRWDAASRAYLPAEITDLPPDIDSHPDPDRAAALGVPAASIPLWGLPYRILIHDLPAYERLARAGALGVGHAYPPGKFPQIIDNRSAPGA